MGRFVNPDNSAFQVAVASEIYIDKTGMLAILIKCWVRSSLLSAIAVRGVLVNPLQQIC